MHSLRNHIEKSVAITDAQFDIVLSASKKRKLKKNQLLLHEGEYSRSDYFVLKGCLRQYFLDDKGKEHVVQFAFADWWIGDWYSIIHQKPTAYQIEAVQTSEVLQFDFDSLQQLFEQVPPLERYFRIIFQQGFAAQQRRILWLQKQAKERYEEFLASYGYFERILSQGHIASYLGITRESLSRLKKQMHREALSREADERIETRSPQATKNL